MLPVTSEYQTAIKATVRKIKGRVQIDYTDPFIDQSIVVSATDQNNISNLNQTADGLKQASKKWIALDGSWVLDGTFYPAEPAEQIGWWGSTLSGQNGFFTHPPTLTIEFFSRPIRRLSVVGDALRGEFAVDFTVKLYDKDNNVLLTRQVVYYNSAEWAVEIAQINEVTKMTLEIHRWSHAGRVVKILEFFTSIQETYEADDILSISLLEEREISNGSLPIGNISANEIEVRLNNINRKFDAGNRQSSLYQLLKANRRIKAWIGLDINNVVEWQPLGTFWSGDWQVPENEIYAHTTGRDRLELLRKSTYSVSQVKINTNLYQLAVDVLQDAEITDYWVDPELMSYSIPYAYFQPISHREALRQIAEACLGQVYCNRNDQIRIEGPSFLTNERTQSRLNITKDDYFTLDQPVQWSQIANFIEVETQPLRPLPLQEVFRSNDPETITAGQKKSITVFYNEPPVIDAIASLTGTGTIQSVTYYAWGANVTVTSLSSGSFTIVINGKPLEIINKQRAIAQDNDSIIDNGRLTYRFPNNHLVQTLTVAQSIANQLINSFKNPRRDVSINWRGNPASELADRFTAPDFNQTADFHVTSQTLDYDGGLKSSIKGRRAN